ncbi:flagellar protein FlbT [Sphingomonas sp. BE123]|jgi:flagellar protein FlbT|uniref:flagellar biosynthesis repressor FlbT n=1 Tax=unclassified Sphingomonas TaxID=196159 RepID=UPI002865B5D3|nr:flagellar biosynthesis repressor FlbT [Sphingomonas sp. BE123]MDR6853498.1 flagellar protein FlbT [Sphingomonas sp. BE123]
MLRISLRDGEALIINGALLRAKGRTELVIENKVALLRGREIMAPEEATTTARRLYLATMMAYLGDSPEEHKNQVIDQLTLLIPTMTSDEGRAACVRFARLVAEGNYYRGLGACRTLIEFEDAATAPADEAA